MGLGTAVWLIVFMLQTASGSLLQAAASSNDESGGQWMLE